MKGSPVRVRASLDARLRALVVPGLEGVREHSANIRARFGDQVGRRAARLTGKLAQDVAVHVEAHRGRVTELLGHLDDGASLGNQERRERVAQVVGRIGSSSASATATAKTRRRQLR
jgi:hypothetical protein